MKKTKILILLVFCLSLFTVHCSKDANPVGPDMSSEAQNDGAVLIGNFLTSGTSAVDFRLIQVSIRNTNLQINPDTNGEFRFNGVPTGNQSVEINVANNFSSIDIAGIQSGEEIRMQLRIQANYSVMLQHMARNKKSATSLQVEIRPKKWNIDWVNSTDEGHARIYGPGFETIALVVITGPTGIEIPVTDIEMGGVYCKAFFDQNAAIAAIPDPKRGERHPITVTITLPDSDPQDLPPYFIEIVGAKSEEDAGELAMSIKPDKWNTNWTKSNGYVTVRFRGESFNTIVPGATSMSYNGGTPISPFWDAIKGSSYQAKFWKKEAIGLFLDPKKGDPYPIEVTVQFNDSSTRTETFEIKIVGSKK